MAVTKLIDALLPSQGVRRNDTHSGVTHVREYQPDRYTIVGNHLAQHRDLSATAIGVAVHILSLPEGAADPEPPGGEHHGKAEALLAGLPRPPALAACEGGCDRPFRAPFPGAWCRDCRAAHPGKAPVAPADVMALG